MRRFELTMMTRRRFIVTSGTLLIATLLPDETLAAPIVERVNNTWNEIRIARNSGSDITAAFILQSLNLPFSSTEFRLGIFELVRRAPYQLGSWNGDSMQLFQQGYGDCRHKAAAVNMLLNLGGVISKKEIVRFDWADLPIPNEILSILPQTQSFHDTVIFDLDGKHLLLDATWDIDLANAGFPIMPYWDGNSSTWPVTISNEVTPMILPRSGQDIYTANQLKWPVKEKTIEFNKEMNIWLSKVRETNLIK
ncbi:Tat pathway signal sequence domain protein [Providencia rettgeri DSM 1131]|nr:Tat pathway signal sequence domain protein [Providencia rettgeri DSM 1131]